MAQKPLAPDEDSVYVNVRLVESMALDIKSVAASDGTTRSAVIREALASYLEARDNEVLAS